MLFQPTPVYEVQRRSSDTSDETRNKVSVLLRKIQISTEEKHIHIVRVLMRIRQHRNTWNMHKTLPIWLKCEDNKWNLLCITEDDLILSLDCYNCYFTKPCPSLFLMVQKVRLHCQSGVLFHAWFLHRLSLLTLLNWKKQWEYRGNSTNKTMKTPINCFNTILDIARNIKRQQTIKKMDELHNTHRPKNKHHTELKQSKL